jgi:pimeloyl-ACP methyl ester carboxylesterase
LIGFQGQGQGIFSRIFVLFKLRPALFFWRKLKMKKRFLPIMIITALVASPYMACAQETANYPYLTLNSYVRDMVNHPAFRGFGERMLPRDNNTAIYDTRLSNDTGRLPYSRNGTPAVLVEALNHNARTLGVSAENYSLWGFSAGARMAARLSSHGTRAYGQREYPKPVAAVIAYTAHSDYTANDPPTYTIAGERDGIAPPGTMERRVNAMRAAGVTVEYRVFPNAPHGFGLGMGTSAEGWIGNAVRFWERYMGGGTR